MNRKKIHSLLFFLAIILVMLGITYQNCGRDNDRDELNQALDENLANVSKIKKCNPDMNDQAAQNSEHQNAQVICSEDSEVK